MKKKIVKTAKKKVVQRVAGEYGMPVYLTINTSRIDRNTTEYTEQVIGFCKEYKNYLYLTVNSGGPNNPPVCPPNGCQ